MIGIPALRVRLAEAPGELSVLCETLCCARITGGANPALSAEIAHAVERDLGRGYAFPGNVRELEQCVRRVLMAGRCQPDQAPASGSASALARELEAGALPVPALVQRYCALLYARTQGYVEVARITGLDRRTLKKQIEQERVARAGAAADRGG